MRHLATIPSATEFRDFVGSTPADFTVYLSGTIRKGREDRRPKEFFWSVEEEEAIRTELRVGTIRVLNPARTPILRGDFRANFGCDLFLIQQSDLMMVDARYEKGLGVGAEMMFAHLMGITTLTICPPNSNYRRDFVPDVYGEDLSDWIHPFVAGLSDHIAGSLEEAITLINRLGKEQLQRTRHEPFVQAVEYFRQKYGV